MTATSSHQVRQPCSVSPRLAQTAQETPFPRRGNRLVPALAFTSRVAREYLFLTYFAIGPHRTVYADEIPGTGGLEARQQLVSAEHRHLTLHRAQPKKAIA